jgi:hypothetical protein
MQFPQKLNRINKLRTLTVGGPLLLVQVTAWCFYQPIQSNVKVRLLRLEESTSYNIDHIPAILLATDCINGRFFLWREQRTCHLQPVPKLTGDRGSAVDIE